MDGLVWPKGDRVKFRIYALQQVYIYTYSMLTFA